MAWESHGKLARHAGVARRADFFDTDGRDLTGSPLQKVYVWYGVNYARISRSVRPAKCQKILSKHLILGVKIVWYVYLGKLP